MALSGKVPVGHTSNIARNYGHENNCCRMPDGMPDGPCGPMGPSSGRRTAVFVLFCTEVGPT